jgi:uncharacterized tellurite resistance protein B-like protein
MLDRLKSIFAADKPPADREAPDTRLAAAVLLIDAARADEDYTPEDKERVTAILKHRFHLADSEVSELMSLAEERAEASVNLHRFTSTVKDNWSEEDRIALVELLWEVAFADGKIHAYEDHLIRRVAGLIYVTDRDRGEARKRVAERLGIE